MKRPAGIGILGGGQLGCMLADAAEDLVVPHWLADPLGDVPGERRASFVTSSDWSAAARELTARAGLLTWDREDVPLEIFADLPAGTAPAAPALARLQDRCQQKQTYDALALPTTPWTSVAAGEDAAAVLERIDVPLVLKARHGGFDGRGTMIVKTAADLPAALAKIPAVGAIAERFIAFDDECALTVVRNAGGEVVSYAPVLTQQRDGQLLWALAPHPLATHLHDRLLAIAHRLVSGLDYVGALTVEFFRQGDSVLINEVAPRVHNSAHWTITGAAASQFTNHLLALLGRPLAPTITRGASLLLNCLGDMPTAVPEADGLFVHDYGKKPRPGRKVGHLTLTAATPSVLPTRYLALPEVLRQRYPGLEDFFRTTLREKYSDGLYPVTAVSE